VAPEVTCPVCRATTGENEVMDNFFVVSGGDNDNGGYDDGGGGLRYCNSCEENATAASRCADCDEYLCSACVRAHLRVKMTKDHVITQLRGPPRRGLVNYNLCQIHPGEKLRYQYSILPVYKSQWWGIHRLYFVRSDPTEEDGQNQFRKKYLVSIDTVPFSLQSLFTSTGNQQFL
jgi:hypothetical protein